VSTAKRDDLPAGAARVPSERCVAENVRDRCVRTFETAWEEAAMQGLCAEGALEYALDRLRHIPVDDLLDDNGGD